MTENFLESHIPSTLYEVIAYFCSGTLFFILGAFGMLECQHSGLLIKQILALDLHEQIALFIISGILTYTYGQLSSTLSSPFIATPVTKLVKIMKKRESSGKKAWVSPDFNINFSETVKKYGLDKNLPEKKINNKWTLMFYLQLKAPDIGKDILKRYAREKLARINALNMIILIIIALLTIIVGKQIRIGTILLIKPVNLLWLVLYAILSVAYCYEYYKRKCWNNDLLLKVLPITEILTSPEAISSNVEMK